MRLHVSAGDASKAWDLRCWLREKMVGFVQREYPGSLPKTRALVGGILAGSPDGGIDEETEPLAIRADSST